MSIGQFLTAQGLKSHCRHRLK